MVLLVPIPVRTAPPPAAPAPAGRRAVDDARAMVADAHHGLRRDATREDADTLRHLYERAEMCRATPDELATIGHGFVRLAESFVAETERRRRPRRRVLGRLGARS
jgi:hypothetical protein